MSEISQNSVQPRFFFLMPVWGEKYIELLLTFALPTLLSPNNLPGLPNLGESEFIFITNSSDEKLLRASHLFQKLESLITINFIFLDFAQNDLGSYDKNRERKHFQLGDALRMGANEALGKGYCLFVHPDALYSDGTLTFLYRVAKNGKKACVSHGSNATFEKVVPYLRERNLLTYDEINPLQPRQLARALMNNLHLDVTIHCMDNPHYPVEPHMGFWLSPKRDGALFRYISLHPFLVDVRHLEKIDEFVAIDHSFIRSHKFPWSDIHVEADSDNFIVVSVMPSRDNNAIPNPKVTRCPPKYLFKTLQKPSNCNYTRFCFFNGLKVHTGDLDADWHKFEVENLKWLNNLYVPDKVWVGGILLSTHLLSAETYRRYRGRFSYHAKTFSRLAFTEWAPLKALSHLIALFVRLLKGLSRPRDDAKWNLAAKTNRFCVACAENERRCVSGITVLDN